MSFSCRTPLCNCNGYLADHVIAIPLANTRDAQKEIFKTIQLFQPGLHPDMILSDITYRLSPEIMELIIRKKENIWCSYIKPVDIQKLKIIWIPIWGEIIVPSWADDIELNRIDYSNWVDDAPNWIDDEHNWINIRD